MHKINVIARGKGSGDAWGASVMDQLDGSPDATRLDLMDKEEKREPGILEGPDRLRSQVDRGECVFSVQAPVR